MNVHIFGESIIGLRPEWSAVHFCAGESSLELYNSSAQLHIGRELCFKAGSAPAFPIGWMQEVPRKYAVHPPT